MANTKALKPGARKAKKRAARKALRELYAAMPRTEKRAYAASEKKGLRAFAAARKAAAAKSAT